MTDPIDTARQEGIALGLAIAAQKYQAMDVMGDDGFPAWDYFAAAYSAILALAPIKPHVAAARVLLPKLRETLPHLSFDCPAQFMGQLGAWGDGFHAGVRAALEQIAKEGE